jgi:hypothetical protein
VLVKIAGAMFGVKHGTGLVVGELFEEDGGLVVLVEDAGGGIAGEPRVKAAERGGYAFADSRGAVGVGLRKSFEAFAETGGIFVSDGEDSDAALGATWLAGKVSAAAAVGVSYGGVYDLDEGLHMG